MRGLLAAVLFASQAVLLTNCGGGGVVNLSTPSITVSVSPKTASVLTSESVQFSATVKGTTNASVTWSVNGLPGGNATVGTIEASGLYTAPAIPPSPNVVTVRAASVVDPTRMDTASVTIANPVPTLSSISPSTIDAGSANTALTVSGTGFARQSAVMLGSSALATTFGSSTQLTVVIPAAQLANAGTLAVTVVTPSPGGGTSIALNLTVLVVVTVSPTSQTVNVTQTQQFTATVTGSPNQTVTWSISGAGTGNSKVGTINVTGLYTAPAVPPTPNPVTIVATSAADATQTGTATVTIGNPAPTLTSISPTAVNAGAPDTALSVGGSNFTAQSVVQANGNALATVFGSSTQLTSTIPASMMVNTGTLSITVNSPAPGGGTSGSADFKIWPSYPRSNAGSVLRTPPPLARIPIKGTTVSVLDWTAKDSNGTQEDVLATDHSLAPMGIPNIDTTDLATSTTNPFLAVAGVLDTSSSLSSTEISSLVAYVKNGGTLYLWRPSVTALLNSLGIGGFNSHSGVALRPLTFDVTKTDPLLRYIDNPVEVNWQLSISSGVTTLGYHPGSCTMLASWSTGDAAVLNCSLGSGRAYVFGWRLRQILTLAERLTVPGIEPPSTNTLVLDADICRLLMRASYEGYAVNPQVRQFAPGGHHAALIITQDVDATTSYSFVPEFADFENSQGFKSTFNFTTNPYHNGWIGPMYVASGMDSIQHALNLGFDVEDHSVGHFPDFDKAPFGTGNETAGNYMPLYSSSTASTSGMSVIGELGVSRWLLENDFGITVDTFRAGHLLIPKNFLQGLTETGYERDSTFAGGLTRGSFPYVTFTVNNSIVTTYPVMEYPLAISDDRGLTDTTLNQTVSEWNDVIRANYANNAPTVLLLHPTNDTLKKQALINLLQSVSDLDLWKGDLKTFATFWESQGVTSRPVPSNITLSISPQAVTVFTGTTQQFTSTVTGTTNQNVTWWVNGVTGGNATFGTIGPTGLYTAPAVPPSPSTVTITAISAADPTRTASASATIVNPPFSITSLSPPSINAGSPDTSLVVTGSDFVPQSVVQANGITLATTYNSSTQLLTTLPSTMLVNATTLLITVSNAAAGGGTTTGVNFLVLAVVAVSPPNASPVTGQTQQFTAAVSGTTNQIATWSIDGAGSGNSTVGTISLTGLYTAPAVVPNPASITVRATSAFDNAGTGTSAVTITSPVEDWPKYRRDLANTGRSAETGLSSANVSLLRRKWTFDTGGKVSASPAMATVGGVSTVFVGSWNGVFYALNAETGHQIWSFPIDVIPNGAKCGPPPPPAVTNPCQRIASSAAVANGKVYFGAGNGFLYALDAATGALSWKIQLGDPDKGAEIWASPAVFNGLVYVGLSSHDDAPCVAGKVFALDATTGAITWSFDVIDQSTCPVPGTCVGGGMWSSPAVDTTFSILYYGSGNPGNGCSPSSPVAGTAYTDGILALDLATGSLKGFFQAVLVDTTDLFDFGSSAVLHTTSQCTSSGFSSWVTEANKGGTVFTLPRGSAGFLSLTPFQNTLNSGELIASPALVASTNATDCNNIYLPTENGYLFNLQQLGDGTGSVSVQSSVAVNISGGCATPGSCPLFSAPAAITDILFFGGGSGSGNFYAYSTAGDRLFTFGTLGLVASGPAISHSRVYFGSFDHFVYCLSINGE